MKLGQLRKVSFHKVSYKNLYLTKNNIIYEIDCSNCQAVCLYKSKLPLKSQSN